MYSIFAPEPLKQPSVFGKRYACEDDTWSFYVGRKVGWKNPINRKSFKEHVKSTTGRHRFWETVERLYLLLLPYTAQVWGDSASPSQSLADGVSPTPADLENLAGVNGEKLEELLQKYVEEEGKLDKDLLDGVKKTFDKAFVVLDKFKSQIEEARRRIEERKRQAKQDEKANKRRAAEDAASAGCGSLASSAGAASSSRGGGAVAVSSSLGGHALGRGGGGHAALGMGGGASSTSSAFGAASAASGAFGGGGGGGLQEFHSSQDISPSNALESLSSALERVSPETVKRIGSNLQPTTAEMLHNLVQTIQTEKEAGGAKGVSPSRNTRSAREVPNKGALVQRQDAEENCVWKELLEDSHAWPIKFVEDVEVSQLMGALSLSGDERAGEESVVFPLVVVRVLQVSCCLFKKMCRICP